MKENKNKYWKSIEERSNPTSFKEAARNEFPEDILEAPSKMSRKKFLSIMGASIALAGLSGCRKPVQKIIPYVNAPENVKLGVPSYYATTMPFGSNAFGVIVENHEGRPTHIEGNFIHNSSLGATNSFVQASILDLYDPDRSKYIRHNNKRSSISSFSKSLQEIKESNKVIKILSPSFSSPSLNTLKSELKLQNIDWVCYDPINNENELQGLKTVTEKKVKAVYHFDKADRILSIDSDFLNMDENSISNTKGFSKKRKVLDRKTANMNRLYVVESCLSTTGAMSDHRLRLKQSDIENFVAKLWGRFNSNKKSKDIFLESLYKDLSNSKFKGKSIVKGGFRLSKESHSLIALMNNKLGNIGKTVNYIALKNSSYNPSNTKDFSNLIKQIDSNKVDCLFILDSNPVYSSKSNYNFKDLLKKVSMTIHLGSHYDETGVLCDWHIPKAHYLESWGDCESLDGTLSITQPLISPLYNSYSALDILSILKDPIENKNLKPMDNAFKIIKSKYSKKYNWNKILYNGKVKNGPSIKKSISIKRNIKNKKQNNNNNTLELVFFLSSSTYDGGFSNNGWLQETPDSISKVTWDNVAIMSNMTAKELKIKNEELINIKYNGTEVQMPAWILPGHADNQISVQVGYGRVFNCKVAKNVGSNVYPLMNGTFSNMSITVSSTNQKYNVACTQDHHGMNLDTAADKEVQNRLPDIYRELNLSEYKKKGSKHKVDQIDLDKHLTYDGKIDGEMKTLYDNPYKNIYDQPYDENNPPQWGMSIDLNSCTGCNSCSIACQSENNIPVVGKEQVEKGREMAWIRIDRYYKGDDVDEPEVAFQPVPCMHCENAPCEQVCPVSATVHDKEGLNAMIYNRCIGTRYCSNNCPYKVRRFNFHNYTYDTPEVVQMAHNPDVTIRFRGVMEKCTFCVQRIKEVEHKSKVEKKPLNQYNLKTACQSACPADCIEFGDIKDPNSDVYKAKARDLDYSLLKELNTRPRTTYLAKLRNPNPELMKS